MTARDVIAGVYMHGVNQEAMADSILSALREAGIVCVPVDKCIFEPRLEVVSKGGNLASFEQTGRFCRTHGWDCPNSQP